MTPVTPNIMGAGTSAEALSDPAWWAPGLALHERTAPHQQAVDPTAGPTAGVATDAGTVRSPGDPEQDAAFTIRLADLGLDEDKLCALVAESRVALAVRTPRPAWASTTERAVRGAVPLPPRAEVAGTWRDAFARVLQPFVDDAVAMVNTRAGSMVSAQSADLPRVADAVGTTLSRRLVGIAARTFVSELHRRRADGRLAGRDGRERFHDFVRGLTLPDGIGGLLAGYPVLARLLAQASDNTVAATLELLSRVADDHAEIVDTLLDGAEPGPVTRVVAGRGDPHSNGRSVAFVDFADGSRVVYKPRDVTAQVHFRRFLAWLDAVVPGLWPRAVRTLARTGYGWSEYVENRPLPDKAAADRFYRRQGALLALLHVLRAIDVHHENVIAYGDQPVVVDVETLFHPELAASGTGDPAADALAASVYRTALLPLIFVGEQGAADMSGLGGDRGGHLPSSVVDWLDAGTDRMRLARRAAELTGAGNRPRLGGQDVEPANHEPALLAGFRQAYDTIAAHRDEFAELVAECAHTKVRVITRPTWVCRTLLDETTHPDVLRDAIDRDRALSVLCAGRSGNPLFAQLRPYEIADLWAGDVPLFVGSAGEGWLRTASGQPLPVPAARPGTAAALDTIAGLGEVDRRSQEWIISASLATRRDYAIHFTAPAVPGKPSGTAAPPDRLLAAACGVADAIIGHGATGDGRINWLGLEAVEDRQWLVLPLGASLGAGYLGVAMFLAQLSAVTGISRYAAVARRAASEAPELVARLADRPDLVAAVGCGGMHGLGGVAYGLARLGLLLGEPALLESAGVAVDLAAASAATATEPGWASGLAGCLAAMTAVDADLGLGAAAATASRCADMLADMADQLADTPVDFADGLAGAGWALARSGPARRHREVGTRMVELAIARQEPDPPPGWCHGSAGLALARTCLPEHNSASDIEALTGGPLRRDLSLCHGELGVTEVLAVFAGADPQWSPTARALRRRTGLVLDVLHRHGPLCGVPRGVLTPGLLTGLAGIGYSLLRLAAPRRVPSVLLLQAPAAEST